MNDDTTNLENKTVPNLLGHAKLRTAICLSALTATVSAIAMDAYIYTAHPRLDISYVGAMTISSWFMGFYGAITVISYVTHDQNKPDNQK
ncbi:MAG: hypothetical protein HY438_01805 [DPANN group archaeon]|nr:hypothetical protein [DPANN group archaeon]